MNQDLLILKNSGECFRPNTKVMSVREQVHKTGVIIILLSRVERPHNIAILPEGVYPDAVVNTLVGKEVLAGQSVGQRLIKHTVQNSNRRNGIPVGEPEPVITHRSRQLSRWTRRGIECLVDADHEKLPSAMLPWAGCDALNTYSRSTSKPAISGAESAFLRGDSEPLKWHFIQKYRPDRRATHDEIRSGFVRGDGIYRKARC